MKIYSQPALRMRKHQHAVLFTVWGRSDVLRTLCSLEGNCLDSASGPGPAGLGLSFPCSRLMSAGPHPAAAGRARARHLGKEGRKAKHSHSWDSQVTFRTENRPAELSAVTKRSAQKRLCQLRLRPPRSAPARFQDSRGHLFCVPAASAARLGTLESEWLFINI